MNLQHLFTVFTARTYRPRGRTLPAVVCSLTAGLLMPAALIAGETHETLETRDASVVAILQQPGSAGEPSIRLKLHGVEDLRLDPVTLPQASDAEEIKKQAQARYLAAKFNKQESVVRKYVDLAWAEAAKREKLAPELLIAIMQKESAFRPKVQSRYGAQGLMQVVRRWHRDKLEPSESLFDPEVNVRVGADVLEEYLAQADGDMERALRKYSGNARGYVNNIRKESRKLGRIAEQAVGEALVAQG